MLGRGAAIIAALLAIALRGLVALIVGPIFGAPINWFALYLGPAIVVELMALTPVFKRPIIFGLVSGLGVATIGLWLESLWIDAVYHYPWPTSIWPEALAMAVPVAILAGACGALVRYGARPSQRLPSPCHRHRSGGAGRPGDRWCDRQRAALQRASRASPPQSRSPTFPSSSPDQRMVSADVQINPPNFVSDNPNWVSVLGWQGGLANQRGQVIDKLETARPRSLPHHPAHAGLGIMEDAAAGARRQDVGSRADLPRRPTRVSAPKEVPAEASMTRPFVAEITILQRERNPDTPMVLWTIGCLVVLFCTLVLIGVPHAGAPAGSTGASPLASKAELQPTAQA